MSYSVMNLLLFCLKLYKKMFDTNFVWPLPCQMAAILNFTHNKMLELLSGHTIKSGIPGEPTTYTFKRDAPSILSKIIRINCFDLAQMAAILDFDHNAMTKVRSGHTRLSDIIENPMVHTKIMLVLLFWKKWYQFISLHWTNGGHPGFYSQCNI